jgi:diguanylate cyclase (GGDEF)-like protein
LIDTILEKKSGSYQYLADGDNHILNVNFLPELKWYLFVEQNEEVALTGIRQTLYANLVISLVITLIVVLLIHLAFSRYQMNIEEMASTDKLTGLLNRHAFTILIDKLMAEYRRTPQPIAVLLADIDHFKDINDRHGHLTGDRVLKHLADQLQNGLRQSDIAVRWGGEEFLMVMKGCDLAEGQRIAETLRHKVEASAVEVNGLIIPVTISIGVSQYDGSEMVDQTVNRADAALYEAKNAGRNRVKVATPANLA